MATISEKYIGDREIHTSPRGARYIITDDGRNRSHPHHNTYTGLWDEYNKKQSS